MPFFYFLEPLMPHLFLTTTKTATDVEHYVVCVSAVVCINLYKICVKPATCIISCRFLTQSYCIKLVFNYFIETSYALMMILK